MQLASRFNGVAECPDIPSALERANELDLFCVDVDVLIGLNVVSRDNEVFSGSKIGDLAQRAFGIDAILRMLTSTVQSAIFGWLLLFCWVLFLKSDSIFTSSQELSIG